MEYRILAYVFTVVSLVLMVVIRVISSKLGKAKKIVENYKTWDLQLWQMLQAYSTLVAELQNQKLVMDKRQDDVSSYISFLRTKERRPSGIEICVQATLPSIKYSNTVSPSLFIGVSFPYENGRVWGVPALKQEIAKATRDRFRLPGGSHELQQVLQFNLVSVAGQIADAVRFYEEAIERVGGTFSELANRASLLSDMGKELNTETIEIEKRINDIVASLGSDQKATVAG